MCVEQNLRVETSAHVEVVIDPAGTRALQLLGGLTLEKPDREAEFEIGEFAANPIARLRKMRHVAGRRPAHAAHQAVAARAAFGGDPGALCKLRDRLHLVYGNSAVETRDCKQ